MSKSTFIEPQEILNASNGGLDIIISLYPDAALSVQQKNRKFKIRDEKTASASLTQHSIQKHGDNNWVVTDFGGDQKPRNGILCYMLEKGLDFPAALQELAARYNVLPEEKIREIFKASFSERPAGPEDEEGVWSWEIRGSFSDQEIEAIISKNVLKSLSWKNKDPKKEKEAQGAYAKIAGAFKEYRWHPLISYSIVKNRKVMTFSSTPDYPIFLIDEGTHQKIYQPKHPDKGHRFMYYGNKPKDYVHGKDQLEKAYKKKEEEILSDKNDQAEQEDRGQEADTKVKSTDVRFDEVILCSGGSDAINVALCGYRVIWLNSETAKLDSYSYNEISKKVKRFYQLPDIDITGKRAAHELAMEYLEIFNIELPNELTRHRDHRGNSCKDVRDFFNHFSVYDFKRLIETALPYRFWEKKARYEGRGENRIFVGYDYEFDNVQGYNFLQKNGFYRIPVGDKESEWEYIKISGNTISKTDPVKIKGFIKEFLKDRLLDKDLRNSMFRTTQMSESSLSNLDEIDIDFTDFDKNSQFVFFKNKTLLVTASEIREFKPGTISKYIWEEEVLDHRFELAREEPFVITKDDLGAYNIIVKNEECVFLKFLIQTSRVHWRAELESERLDPDAKEKYLLENKYNIAGPNLTEEEQEEQKQHLINKIFTIGYLLHRYKDRSRPWFVYAMDNRISDDGRSHGGSGKSLLLDLCMRTLLKKNFYINGRIPKQMEDSHKYDGLTEHDRYVLIEDANEFFRLDILFNDVTGDIKVNPKGKKPFTIPFDKAPKFAVTTNYTARNLDSSTIRRMLYTVFSDYYHTAGETNDYKETRDPATEFGLNMIKEFDQAQFNHFYNTMVHCLKFYLSCTEKIGPAMNNVTKRQLLATMGDTFHDWAIAYFSEEGDKLDTFLVRQEVYQDYKLANPGEKSPQAFMEKLKAFCRLYEYTLNPVRFRDKKGKIIKKVEPKEYDPMTRSWRVLDGQKVTKEMMYIQTKFDLPEEVQPDYKPADDKKEEDLDAFLNDD